MMIMLMVGKITLYGNMFSNYLLTHNKIVVCFLDELWLKEVKVSEIFCKEKKSFNLKSFKGEKVALKQQGKSLLEERKKKINAAFPLLYFLKSTHKFSFLLVLKKKSSHKEGEESS